MTLEGWQIWDLVQRLGGQVRVAGGMSGGAVLGWDMGAAGVEVAQSVLAETQSAILPLVPYLDTLRWVFIVVALGGIAVTIYARLDDWRRGRR
jgi:zinc D-Ala-D-Ala carboxypeptidase